MFQSIMDAPMGTKILFAVVGIGILLACMGGKGNGGNGGNSGGGSNTGSNTGSTS